ncbi:hypothetical protein HZC33_02175 [Candidatus Wolfebacteria bacterium]|nr:hypothetical protein [Candidatus Wolfebacteria bacterium]
MTSRNKFIDTFEDNNLQEINSLIDTFLELSNISITEQNIPEFLKLPLKKAITYWVNLTKSEEYGVRDKERNRGFYKILYHATVNQKPINYIIFLCPSYKKGVGSIGIRSEPGQTTYLAFNNAKRICENTQILEIPCDLRAYFYDIGVENASKFMQKDWEDLEKNILIDKVISKVHNIPYDRVSNAFSESNNKIGKYGISDTLAENLLKELNVNNDDIQRVIERSTIFYSKTLGWRQEECRKRALSVAYAYILDGIMLCKMFHSPIEIYSAHSYERSFLYTPKGDQKRIGVIYPPKAIEDSTIKSTIPIWQKI